MALGQRVAAEATARRVGVVELDALPSGSYDDFSAAAPAVELVDATALFAQARRGADTAERHLLACADAIAVAALAQVDATSATDAGSIAGAVEKHARLAGAEEVYITVAPDLAADRRMIRPSAATLGDIFALRASIAYKGCWVRRTRTFAKDAAGRSAVARADAWFVLLAQSIVPGKPLADQINTQVQALAAEPENWMAESCIGTYPLQVTASSRSLSNGAPAAGDFIVLSLALTIDGSPWVGAAPLIVGAAL